VITPRKVESDRAAGTLEVLWEDGHESLYSLPDLRWACPCAVCSGEWGQPGLLSTLDSLLPNELLLEDIKLVGSYAITITWTSGHSAGIYAFDYLRSLCPCDECRARRADTSVPTT
jgi:DUF971 family protein